MEENIVRAKDIPYLSKELEEKVEELQHIMMIYGCGIREISTKLEILNEEFRMKSKRNPIEYMKSRIKSPKSMVEKLSRKGFPVNWNSVRENLNDIAGIRVNCTYVEDIYIIAQMLKSQDDITLIMEKDYIKHPKPNGYRSLHLVLEVPVFFSDYTEQVKVEVQIRTIAMDFWASLEHQLHYKTEGAVPQYIADELKECADVIAYTDLKMQHIHDHLEMFG